MKLKFKITLLLLSIFFNGFSQNVHEHYQDGIVVFELQPHAKMILSADDKSFDVKKVPYLSSIHGVSIKSAIQLYPEIEDDRLVRTYQVELQDPYQVDDVIRKLNAVKELRYAERKELPKLLNIPNDPGWSQGLMWGLEQVEAEGAWALSTGDANVVVAVTDNAIQTNHPDLTNKMLPGHNSAEGTNDPNPCGGNNGFHGSHVSGTVGAETDNGTGVPSIGWDISILPVAIGRCSDGALTGGYDGIVWAADNGADVINMSWGGPGSSQQAQNVINYAWNQGCILIAAAGNDNESTQFYPAAYNNVVSVAATDPNDQKANFSQYGNWIDISAPGTQIMSTDEDTGYQYSQGTSMASPLVAGFMGLMKSFAPNASNTDLIQCLYDGAEDIDAQNPSFIGQLGEGRMNAEASMICAQQFNVQVDAGITEIISPTVSLCDNSFTAEVELTNFGGNNLTSVTIDYEWNGNNQSYNWSGNLSTGQSEIVTLGNHSDVDGNYTFTAETNQPNGTNDQNPANDSESENFALNGSGQEVELNLLLDCYAEETSWEIIDDANGNVVASGGGYQNSGGNTLEEYLICLPAGCYDFVISDTYGDGLNGSQWQNCSVDGDYEILDENGNTLVEMTAQDGDFGFEESHNFCITNQAVQNDAGIQNILSPQNIACDSEITPEVTLRNYGADPLTSVEINYQTTGGLQTFNWTGNLSTNQTEAVTLPSITSGAGNVTLSVYTSNPNGQQDDNPLNDDDDVTMDVFTTAQSLPFQEDFENSPFGNNGWLIDNPDNAITWEEATVSGNTPGNTAMKLDFYNYQANSERDGLITPLISLSGYTSVDLDFEHAYRRYDQSAADSLVVYISTDCGETFQRLAGYAEDGTGSFATQTTNTNPFTPQDIEDWCLEPIIGSDCFTVNLDTYIGMDVFIKFESFNAGNVGNNLYIDNINIDGVPNSNPPTPNLSADNNTICEGETVNFTDQSTSNITSWNWTFPGGTPATSTDQNPSVVYNDAGTYDVILEVTNAHGTESTTFTNEIAVNNPPNVSITANDMEICEGSSTQLSASGANTYTWDNNLGSGSTKTISPNTTTIYTVTGSNGVGCEDQETITIEVLPDPTINLTASSQTICNGDQTTLTASGGDFYTWNNGLPQSNEHTVSPSSNTVYTVEGFNTANCSSSESILIEVQEEPEVSLSISDTEICEGESVSISASGAENYSWTPTSGLSSSTSSSVTASPSGTVTYTVTGSNSCGSDAESVTISVSNPPTNPTITQNGNDLSVNVAPGETVEWYLDGVLIGTGDTIEMQGSGEYEAVVSNDAGCTESSSGNFDSVASLTDLDKENNIVLYPNPNDGRFTLEINGVNEDVNITIIDATGRIVRNSIIVKAEKIGNIPFDISDLEKGVYMLTIESDLGNLIKKVTVK